MGSTVKAAKAVCIVVVCIADKDTGVDLQACQAAYGIVETIGCPQGQEIVDQDMRYRGAQPADGLTPTGAPAM